MIVRKKRHALLRCAICDGQLHGVPHGKTISGMLKLSKTQKRPSAPFAGILCATCRTSVIMEKANVEMGFKTLRDVDLELQKYVKQVATPANGGY